MTRFIATAATALLFAAGSMSAQTPPPKVEKVEKKVEKAEKAEKVEKVEKMDHGQMDQDKHHAMSPWKELDEFHMLVMDTWHPAKEKNDMKPTREKANDLVKSARKLAASPAPAGCDSPKLKEAAAGMPTYAQNVSDLVAKKADDAALKAALKTMHDKFEVIEGGCTKPKDKKH